MTSSPASTTCRVMSLSEMRISGDVASLCIWRSRRTWSFVRITLTFSRSFNGAAGMSTSSNSSIGATINPVFAPVNTISTMTFVGTVGDYIRARRRELGVTQERLSEDVGIAQNTLSAIERGVITIPRHPTLVRIADVLGVPVADLYVAAGAAMTLEEADRIVDAMPSFHPADPRIELVIKLGEIFLSGDRLSALTAILDGWLAEDRALGREKRKP